MLAGVREKHPDTWILGEVIHGDYVALVRDSGWDSLTQYELWKAIWSSIQDRNLWELAWALQRGYAVIPSSTKRENLASNLLARDLRLDADDMARLDALAQRLDLLLGDEA